MVNVKSALPRIGITCAEQGEPRRFCLAESYVEAVVAAGGLPLMLPALRGKTSGGEYAGVIDGLLLTGGGDVDPVYYGQEPQWSLGRVTPWRDEFEVSITRRFLELGKPILGICRGAQVLNVAAGGSLIQDLKSEWPGSVNHYQNAPRDYATHSIIIEVGTVLAQIYGLRFRVNSFHHQAVGQVPADFLIAARSPDGVIEAVEKRGGVFVVGVQWHPETMWANEAEHLELFRRFVRAAAQREAVCSVQGGFTGGGAG